MYAPSAILCVCARTRSEGVACLNLDGGGLALAERQRERGRERDGCMRRMVYFKTFIVVYFLSSGDDTRLLGFRCFPHNL